MTDLIVRHVPLWLPFAVVLATQIITLFFLHERERRSPRWWARNAVIALGIVGAGVAYMFQVRSQQIAHLVQGQVNLTVASVAKQQLRLRQVQLQLARQRQHIAQVDRAANDAFVVLKQTQHELEVRRQSIATLSAYSAALKIQSNRAILQSNSALTLTHNVEVNVARNAQVISSRIQRAESISRESVAQANKAREEALQAAARAGVFHFPRPIAERAVTLLRSVAPQRAEIACAPGLEAACSDLRDIFTAARWTPLMDYGAAFSGGFEIQVPDPSGGLIVWYLPKGRSLATRLAVILSDAVPSVIIQESLGTPNSTLIGISLRFVTK